MNKLVYSVFKTIAFAMIFVFVFDMGFYLYRVFSINQRAENILTSMQKVVMENNCLPQEDAEMYQQILEHMAADFNGGTFVNNNDGSKGEFVAAIDWNMTHDAMGIPLDIRSTRSWYNGTNWTEKSVDIVHKQMGDPGAYGDIQTVQLRIKVWQPFWGFGGRDAGFGAQASDSVEGGENGAPNWKRVVNYRSTVLTYTYFVPCLKYKSVTQ